MKDKGETEQDRWGESSEHGTGLTPVKEQREGRTDYWEEEPDTGVQPREHLRQADGKLLRKDCLLEESHVG